MPKQGEYQWENYSILSIWSTDHAGLYSISADKGSDKYPPLGLIDAIKAFASGARMSIRINAESQRSSSGGGYGGGPSHSGDDFGADDVPF